MTSEQATKIMKLLEMKSSVYELEMDSIPIWWFIRFRFYDRLLNYLNQEEEKKETFKNRNISIRTIIYNCKKSGVFLLRSLSSLIHIATTRYKKRPILFLVYPTGFKKTKEEIQFDIYINSTYQKLSNKSIVIERPTLKEQDLQSFLFRKNTIFLDWAILFSILKNCFKLWKIPKINNWKKFKNKCEGVNFEIISSKWILNTIKELIFSTRNKIIIQITAAEIILNRFKPKVIVETVSYDSGTVALNLIAKRQNIPVIELQHGIITKNHIGYIYFIPSDYTKNKPLPDKILVYGEAFKKAILRTGNAFSSKDIIVTGFPRLNNFLSQAQSKREFIRVEARKKLGIDNNIFLATITSQPITNSYLSHFLEKAIPLLEKNIIICVKLHPSELDDWGTIYRDISFHPQVKIVSDNDINLYELLISSDVHATVCSTVFLECLALGIPNVILKGPGYSFVLELVKEDEILIADNPEEFVKLLNKLKLNKNSRNAIIQKEKEICSLFFARKNSSENLILEEIAKLYDKK